MPTTNYTDTQLLRMFPVLLPEEVGIFGKEPNCFYYLKSNPDYSDIDSILENAIKPTEYLDLCRRIEEKMNAFVFKSYAKLVYENSKSEAQISPFDGIGLSFQSLIERCYLSASWQQRLIAACEVFGKEIPEV